MNENYEHPEKYITEEEIEYRAIRGATSKHAKRTKLILEDTTQIMQKINELQEDVTELAVKIDTMKQHLSLNSIRTNLDNINLDLGTINENFEKFALSMIRRFDEATEQIVAHISTIRTDVCENKD